MQAAFERVPLESRSTCLNLHKNRCGRFSYLPNNLQWLWLHCQLFKLGSAWLTISSLAALIANPSSHHGASLRVRQRSTAPEEGTPAQPHCAALMAAEPLHTSCTHSSVPCWERALLPEGFWSFAEAGRASWLMLCALHTHWPIAQVEQEEGREPPYRLRLLCWERQHPCPRYKPPGSPS